MKVLLPFLSLLLLVSVCESLTGKGKKRDLSDEEQEYKIVIEHAQFSESAEDFDLRETSVAPDDEMDLDSDYPYEEYSDVRQNLEEEASRPILKEVDTLGILSSGHYGPPRYDKEGNAVAIDNLDDFEWPQPRRLNADGVREVAQGQLSGTKTYVCNNRIEIYRTITVDFNDSAILYSPSYLQRREYPSNSNCGWRLETSSPHHLSFNCSQFDVREGDYLSLRDDKSSDLERFSGGRRLKHVTKMNSAFVVFYSNDEESGRGFNCTVTSVRKRDSVDVEPRARSEIELASERSLIANHTGYRVGEAAIPVSPPVEFISEKIPETSETRIDVDSMAERHDPTLNKSTVEKVDEGASRAIEDRPTYMKLETTNSSMHAGVYSNKVLQNVVDAMGKTSEATRLVVNSTRVVGITTNVVEKKEDGGGARHAGSYVYDPTRSNLPGHATTSVLESNMSSETREKSETVRDDLTGESRQENTSYTTKSSCESTEIKSSRTDFPEELIAPTPPL